MAGIFHAYYTVALAPAIAALVGIGAAVWRHRRSPVAGRRRSARRRGRRGDTGFVLLGRSPDFVPWLRWVVWCSAWCRPSRSPRSRFPPRRVALVTRPPWRPPRRWPGRRHFAVPDGRGDRAHRVDPDGRPRGSPPRTRRRTRQRTRRRTRRAHPADSSPGAFGGPPAGMQQGTPAPGRPGMTPPTTPGGGQGMPLGIPGAPAAAQSSEPSAELTALLGRTPDSYTWVAAAVGSNSRRATSSRRRGR